MLRTRKTSSAAQPHQGAKDDTKEGDASGATEGSKSQGATNP